MKSGQKLTNMNTENNELLKSQIFICSMNNSCKTFNIY